MATVRRRLKTSEIPILKRALIIRQDGKCPVCGCSVTLRDALDHDHVSGLVRGVLCLNCNGIEGKIRNLVTRGRRGALHKDYLGRLLLYWIHHEQDRTGLYHPLHKTADEKRDKINKKARERRAKVKLAASTG